MRTFIAVIAAASLAAGIGCSSMKRQAFAEPVVTLRDVRLNGFGLTGGSLDVVLNVYNPNGYRLDATGLTYEVLVDTVRLGTGGLDQRFVVQEGDSAQVRLPLSFSYAGVGQAGRELLNTGSVNYRVRGDLRVGSPVGSFTIPYDRTGRFSTLGGTTR